MSGGASRDSLRRAVLGFVTTVPDSASASLADDADSASDGADVQQDFAFDQITPGHSWDLARVKARTLPGSGSTVDEKIRRRIAARRAAAEKAAAAAARAEAAVADDEASTEFVVDDANDGGAAASAGDSDSDAASSDDASGGNESDNSDDDGDDSDGDDSNDDDSDDDDDDDDNDKDDIEADDDDDANDAQPLSDAELAALADLNGANDAALPADDLVELQGSKKMKDRAKAAEASFFAPAPAEAIETTEFSDMQLSRPILKAIADLGWTTATPIQARMIPVALLGRDVCANAVTGSGKTAAFTLPVLERLMHRPAGARAAVRCVILLPTRELAAQCFSVVQKLARFIDVDVAAAAGGTSIKREEAALRQLPDIVVATPGRFIDHVRNTRGFYIDSLEVLILDEADRLLELGFEDALTEILRLVPNKRQTVLCSATMTSGIDRLTKLSLHQPVRISVDALMTVARRLTQEFVRVSDAHSADQRLAVTLALCTRSITERTIVFCTLKKEAHRVRVVMGLAGLRAAELHGDMKQRERLEALEQFRDGDVDFLVATDVAARGLDIAGVQNVVNYSMPRNHKTYVHRVGRTARAEQAGRSVSLIGEHDRALLKQICKSGRRGHHVLQRVVPKEAIKLWLGRVKAFEADVNAIFREERRERELDKAQMQLEKAENLIKHHAEIARRPARTWFQSADEKREAAELARLDVDDSAEPAALARARRLLARAKDAKRPAAGAAAKKGKKGEEARKRPRARSTERYLRFASEAELEAGKAAQKAAKRKYTAGELTLGVDPKERKRKKREREQQAAQKQYSAAQKSKHAAIDARIRDGALTFAQEMERLEAADRSQKKNRRLAGQKSHHAFKSKKRYKRRK